MADFPLLYTNFAVIYLVFGKKYGKFNFLGKYVIQKNVNYFMQIVQKTRKIMSKNVPDLGQMQQFCNKMLDLYIR